MDSIGAVLRRLRTERGLSLRDVQERAGISNAYLSQVERGLRPNPSPRFLRKLAEVYQVSLPILVHAAGRDPGPPAEMTELDRNFEYVLSDPNFSYGHRLGGGVSRHAVPDEAKQMIVQMYERLTGKNLTGRAEGDGSDEHGPAD